MNIIDKIVCEDETCLKFRRECPVKGKELWTGSPEAKPENLTCPHKVAKEEDK